MRRPLAGCLTLLALLVAAAPLHADACALENLPAATLLLPYFEVDLSNPNGRNTLFSINNASATAALVNVVVWSDLGVPTMGFPVYLTGYDVQTFNLRDLFNGNLPGTATAGQDPTDQISPKGVYSQDVNFASCLGSLPLPALPADFVAHLRAAHTGQFSTVLDGCAGQRFNDNVARGYVTADTVNHCTLLTPADPGYFGPAGAATNQNILWGDFLFVDPASNYADGESLVRVEAFPGTFKAGDLTFYGRYVGMSGVDGREPLATTWASRYVNGGAFSGGTDLVVWRDSAQIVRPFPCGTSPGGFPLLLNREHVFDEQERAMFVSASPVPPAAGEQLPAIFPAEANRIKVGSAAYPVPFDFGWLYADLNAPVQGGGRMVRQSWMGTVMKAQGRFSVGFNATPLDSACAPAAPFNP
ncbi:MAG: hypothetical protein DMF53_08665 [Acidobacteria bacterium]|nr:MAG: hypothetical protein DMF53_08665 [Acidobacteriota bacterium]